MPAYFDLALQFRKTEIAPGFVTRFHAALAEGLWQFPPVGGRPGLLARERTPRRHWI